MKKDYEKFECIMHYENKKKLVDLLNKIKEIKDIEYEDEILCLVNNFDIES